MDSDSPPFPVNRKRELPLAAILWFLALLILLFLPVLKSMVSEWAIDENMGHAFFVPLVAGYIVWADRARILAAPVKPYWPALGLVVWGFCQMLVGFLGAIFFVQETAFVIAVIGVVWTIGGTAVLRTLALPLFLLAFLVRIPLFVYQQMTLPLQMVASQLATRVLDAIGIPVLREGNVIQLASRNLDVVEACSGIRSLMSLTFLTVVYGHLFERRRWLKLTLLASAIPIAIVCNATRITLTGVLTQYKPEIAEGAYHAFEGWVIFMFDCVVLLCLHRLLVRLARLAHA